MREITAYSIVKNEDALDLSDYITRMIDEGWQPYGSPFTYTHRMMGTFYCQAMVVYEDA